MRRLLDALPLLVLTTALACPPAGEYRVVRVIDGDTIVLENDERVRYIGIDSPELGKGDGSEVRLADEAREFNRGLVEEKRVRLEFDEKQRDRYGRLLAYVYLGDLMVNEELVRSGLARARDYPPNLRYRERFEKAEGEAKERGLGLWGELP